MLWTMSKEQWPEVEDDYSRGKNYWRWWVFEFPRSLRQQTLQEEIQDYQWRDQDVLRSHHSQDEAFSYFCMIVEEEVEEEESSI